MQTIIINTDPIKEEHISWYTQEEGHKIILIEVVEAVYEHPDANGFAVIRQLETRRRKTVDRAARRYAAHLELLENALNVVSKIERRQVMKPVLVTVSRGIIDQVLFFEDEAQAVKALEQFVKGMNEETEDAGVYGPDGLIVNAKMFMDE